jgi:hypothetical protein
MSRSVGSKSSVLHVRHQFELKLVGKLTAEIRGDPFPNPRSQSEKIKPSEVCLKLKSYL